MQTEQDRVVQEAGLQSPNPGTHVLHRLGFASAQLLIYVYLLNTRTLILTCCLC